MEHSGLQNLSIPQLAHVSEDIIKYDSHIELEFSTCYVQNIVKNM